MHDGPRAPLSIIGRLYARIIIVWHFDNTAGWLLAGVYKTLISVGFAMENFKSQHHLVSIARKHNSFNFNHHQLGRSSCHSAMQTCSSTFICDSNATRQFFFVDYLGDSRMLRLAPSSNQPFYIKINYNPASVVALII